MLMRWLFPFWLKPTKWKQPIGFLWLLAAWQFGEAAERAKKMKAQLEEERRKKGDAALLEDDPASAWGGSVLSGTSGTSSVMTDLQNGNLPTGRKNLRKARGNCSLFQTDLWTLVGEVGGIWPLTEPDGYVQRDNGSYTKTTLKSTKSSQRRKRTHQSGVFSFGKDCTAQAENYQEMFDREPT